MKLQQRNCCGETGERFEHSVRLSDGNRLTIGEGVETTHGRLVIGEGCRNYAQRAHTLLRYAKDPRVEAGLKEKSQPPSLSAAPGN
jgi:hypothetical protein